MKWVSDTGPFIAALEEVRLAFQEVVSGDIRSALAEQEHVAERLRTVEKRTAAVVSQISKQISNNNLKHMAKETAELEDALNTVEAKLDACIDSILRIDQNLPSNDRLIAPGLPNGTRYELLHQKISEKSVGKQPEALNIQQSRPEAKVNKDHITKIDVHGKNQSFPPE